MRNTCIKLGLLLGVQLLSGLWAINFFYAYFSI